jgi:aspartyl-tRNA(Asn)/glutamyl-tRNA(Gln) amidotransferase subunit C
MSLTLEEVEHIAQLARLELSDAEKARYREQLSDILEYAARLQTVETGEIAPTSTVLTERSRLRPDEAAPGLGTTATLRNAPHVTDNQFKVPPVME